jgi:hypothetical protein
MWIRPSFTAASAADLVTYVQLFGKVELLELPVAPHCTVVLSKLHNAHSRIGFGLRPFASCALVSTSSTPHHHLIE